MTKLTIGFLLAGLFAIGAARGTARQGHDRESRGGQGAEREEEGPQ